MFSHNSYKYLLLLGAFLYFYPLSAQEQNTNNQAYQALSDAFKNLEKNINSLELSLDRKAEYAFDEGEYDEAYQYCEMLEQKTGERIGYLMWKSKKCKEIKRQLGNAVSNNNKALILSKAIELLELNEGDSDAIKYCQMFASDIPQVLNSCLSKGKYYLCDNLLYYYENSTGFANEKLKDVISTCQSLQGEMTYELFIGNRYNVKEKAKSIIAINPVDEYAQLLMKEQPLSYYNNHVSDITSEANALFTIGDYDRVISLCDKYSSLTGSKTLDSLKSKAQKCKGYREEILAIESQGELYVDYEYAPIFEIINKLLEINPYDLNAIDYYMMGWK